MGIIRSCTIEHLYLFCISQRERERERERSFPLFSAGYMFVLMSRGFCSNLNSEGHGRPKEGQEPCRGSMPWYTTWRGWSKAMSPVRWQQRSKQYTSCMGDGLGPTLLHCEGPHDGLIHVCWSSMWVNKFNDDGANGQCDQYHRPWNRGFRQVF
jgi:hypothetical protein